MNLCFWMGRLTTANVKSSQIYNSKLHNKNPDRILKANVKVIFRGNVQQEKAFRDDTYVTNLICHDGLIGIYVC